jgi:hypothetical protein
VLELVRKLETAGAAAGFRSEHFGESDGCPLLALTKRSEGPRPRIYLSAGIHGDEPASTLAVLRLLEGGLFDHRAEWFLCPLLNPAGLVRGTRENAAGIDLNRDYKNPVSEEVRAHVAWLGRQPVFDLALCVHEDWEATGFYLYELNPGNLPSLAEPMIATVASVCPIDPSPLIDGREASGGILRPQVDPRLREKCPESIRLQAHGARLGYTLETPSAFPLEQRIAAHRAAVGVAVAKTLESKIPHGPGPI